MCLSRFTLLGLMAQDGGQNRNIFSFRCGQEKTIWMVKLQWQKADQGDIDF